MGAPSFSKLVHNLRLGPPLARSTFVPRCSNRLGPPEPSDRQVGPSWAVFGAPGPNLGAPSFSKLVHNLRLVPPTARSTFVPRCSNRLGPPEPSDRHFGLFGLFLGRFWALEVPNLTNFVSGKWNEARGTLRVEKNKPVDPNGKKNFGPPPLTHCVY